MVNTIFILDQHYQVINVLTINGKNTFFDDLYSIDLSTGVESFEFSTNVDNLCETHYIMFYYHDQYKLFQITELEQEHSEGKIITYCYGESACLELLNGVVQANNFGEGPVNCIQFIEYVLQGTDWQIGRYSSSLETNILPQLTIDKTSQRWSLIQDYMSEFGYEINTRIIYENGFIRAKLIDIYADGELGEKTYKRFQYGINVEGIIKKKDLYEWCTALIIDSSEDVNSVEFEKGAYIKPLGTDIIIAKYENNLYNLGRNYIYSTYEDNSPTPQEAVENAYHELKRRATPRFDYECTTVMTYEEYEDMSIGDTVYVIDTSFNPPITLEARIGNLELSFTDRNNCKCNLTNYKEVKSGIDVTLSAGIKEIVDTYFPITGDKIAGETINPDNLKEEVYELIRTNYIKAEIAEFDKVIAETFVAKEAYVEDLGVVNADIENLKAEDAKIKNATINNLNAINANIQTLRAKDAEIENLIADMIDVEDLTAINAEIENLKATKAEIDDLDAINADIGKLNADVANIDTLLGGNIGTGNLTTIRLTADNVKIDDALIKSAHIEEINTDLVSVKNSDGSLLLTGSLLQFKDDRGSVRIQMGKGGDGKFSFALMGDGELGTLIDENGIVSGEAIRDNIIVNDHISNGAGISGSKLDIDSVITSINENGDKTINSNKIYLDEEGQSLDVAFENLSVKVNTATGDVSGIVDKYSDLKISIDELSGKVGSIETDYKSQDELLGIRVSEAEEKITDDAITNTVSQTFYTKVETNDQIDNLLNATDILYANKNDFDVLAAKMSSQMNQTASDIEMKFTVSYQYTNSIENDLNDFKDEISTNIRFDADGIELGKSNSPFKTKLDNEKLAFTENNNEVAYISNNKMYITEVEVKDSLVVGQENGFYWRLEDNGHLRLRWKGRD